MQRARCVVDVEPPTQRIKRRRRAGKSFSGDGQRVNRLLPRDLRQLDPFKFGIQKFDIKSGVVNDKL